jgi:pyruvate dehydrogenase E1 component
MPASPVCRHGGDSSLVMTVPAAGSTDSSVLPEIHDRLMWLATAMIHHANNKRSRSSSLKVGGHQSSSASMVSIMTALWFGALGPEDRVAVKPHASPVLHAINYLLGALDESYLSRLRDFGGLQSYPSRTKDPDPVDYSTGSVGIGATAPIWGALARRYIDTNFGAGGLGRQYSLVGDAELDEGAVWEAVLDPMVAELGEIVWVVDLNRQSLDRVVPDIAVDKLQGMFAAAGWQVLTLKYGRLLEELLGRPGGQSLRNRIDAMTNPEYQRILRCDADELRNRLPGSGSGAADISRLIADVDDGQLVAGIGNLGGHDLHALTAAFAEIDDSRPTVIFAYTVKGYGLPTQGHPQNHSAMLSDDQMVQLADRLGASSHEPWAKFTPGSPADLLCTQTAIRLRRNPIAQSPPSAVPVDFGRSPSGTVTTQAALGRTLLDLSRQAPETARRVVTVSPDVSSSTNLGGWVNKVGLWSPKSRTNWFADDAETILHWRESPAGQHVELGIAEVNLVGLLGELGATWSRWGQPLLPIGVLYDPFVERALEPWSFGIYAGGQSILVGTPSGVTLAPEGGAHQSIKTPSIGIEQPGCISFEPAFAIDTEWILLACMAELGRPGGSSSYLRLSTRPVDQALAQLPSDPAARERRRRQAVAGGYVLRTETDPRVRIAAVGAVVPEAILAAEQLARLGTPAEVVCVTSPDLLYRAVRAGQGHQRADAWILDQLFPADRPLPLVTVLDGHPHALTFLAIVNRVRTSSLGVTRFGQSGSLEDVYRLHGLDADSITRAALDIVD